MGTRLFVAGVAWRTTEEALARHIGSVGEVTDLRLITDRETGRSKGYAFVEMATPEQAARAIRELDGVVLDDRPLAVQEARPRAAEPGAPPRHSAPHRSRSEFADRRRW